MYLLFPFFLFFSILYFFLSYDSIAFQFVLVPGTDFVENNVVIYFFSHFFYLFFRARHERHPSTPIASGTDSG